MRITLQKAYEQGYLSASQGFSIQTNPFSSYDELYWHWRSGWNDGKIIK